MCCGRLMGPPPPLVIILSICLPASSLLFIAMNLPIRRQPSGNISKPLAFSGEKSDGDGSRSIRGAIEQRAAGPIILVPVALANLPRCCNNDTTRLKHSN